MFVLAKNFSFSLYQEENLTGEQIKDIILLRVQFLDEQNQEIVFLMRAYSRTHV